MRQRSLISPQVALGATIVAALWSICYPLVTVAVAYAPPLSIAALRAMTGGLALLLVGIMAERPFPRGRQWVAILAIGLTSTTLGFGGMFLAGGRVSPGIAEVVSNAQPFIAALLAFVALGEGLRRGQLAGMALAFLGIIIVALPALSRTDGGAATGLGLVFVGIGAIGVAGGNVLMKHFSNALDPLVTTAVQLLFGGAILSVVAFVIEPIDSIQWSMPLLGALLGLAVPGTAVAYVLWFGLLKHAPLNSLNIFSFLAPVFGLALAWWFFDERLSLGQFGGAGLVIVGAVVASLTGRKVAK